MSGPSRVAVVGGGIGGLCAARALRRAGQGDVVLFEAGDRVGGVIRTERSPDGYLHEWAANGFLANAPDGAIALAEELGLPFEEASSAAKKRWIFLRDKLIEAPSSLGTAIRTDLISWRAKFRALVEPFKPVWSGGDESVFDFAARRLGPEFASAAIAPMVTGVFAGDARQLSLPAAFPKMAALEQRGGVFRGTLSLMRERRRERRETGVERRKATLCAPIGGMAGLVNGAAADLEGAIRTGAAVEAVETVDGGRLRLRGRGLGADADAPFDAVVLAVNAPVAADIVRPIAPAAAGVLGDIEYVPVAVTYLGFRREELSHPLDGFGFIVAEGEDLRVLGCVFESVLFSDRAPEGHVLLRCVMGGQRDPEAVDLDDAELVRIAHRDLGHALGIDAAPVHSRVLRHRRAIAQYKLGHIDRVAEIERELEPAGIVLGGASYHGVAVNSCIADASRVASRVSSRLVALVACVALAAVAACSGGASSPSPKTPAVEDAGDAGQAVAEPVEVGEQPDGVAPGYRLALSGDTGTLEIKVVWPSPAAALLRSPGRNACGAERRAAIPVEPDGVIADRYATERMVALAGAVVRLDDIRAGKAPPDDEPAELAVSDCVLSPRVARVARVGSALAVINDDERRHRVRLEHVGDGDSAPRALVDVPLPVAGRRVEVRLDEPGIVRAVSEADPADVGYAVVPAHPYVDVTDAAGVATFEAVPAGSHRIAVWYPPVEAGGSPRSATADVVVEPGQIARATVRVGP